MSFHNLGIRSGRKGGYHGRQPGQNLEKHRNKMLKLEQEEKENEELNKIKREQQSKSAIKDMQKTGRLKNIDENSKIVHKPIEGGTRLERSKNQKNNISKKKNNSLYR